MRRLRCGKRHGTTATPLQGNGRPQGGDVRSVPRCGRDVTPVVTVWCHAGGALWAILWVGCRPHWRRGARGLYRLSRHRRAEPHPPRVVDEFRQRRPAAACPCGGEEAALVKEARSEAHVSAQQPAPREASRVPAPDGDPRGSGHRPDAPAEGPRPPVGLIWRVRDRATFEAFRREGRRARRGDVSVAFVPAPHGPPRVAYGIGRHVGPAVVRNRVRRRLRAAAREIHGADGLAPGAYLVTVRPGAASLPYADLRRRLADACAAASSPSSGARR